MSSANTYAHYNTGTNTYWAGEKLGGYQTLVGRTNYSEFGRGLDASFDGRRVIVGAPRWGPANQYGQNRGYVEIFDYNVNNDSWQTITGGYIESPDTTVGQGTGRTSYDNNTVIPVNGKIYTTGGGGLFGESVSMTWDGDRIVVGAPGINKVYVYDYNGTSWGTPQTISAPSGITSFGHCVSLAGDKGDRFAVGAPESNKVYVYEKLGTATSFTLVYTDNGSSLTNSLPLSGGGSTTLNSAYNGYGYHVRMADFGDHMVVGAPGTYLENLENSFHSSNFSKNVTHYSTHNSTPGSHAPFRTGQYNPSQFGLPNNAYPRTPLAILTAQIGQVRIMKCTPDVSWGTTNAVSQMGNVIPGYDEGVVKIDTFNNSQQDSFGGFGSVVQINPEGTRIAVSSPYYKYVHPKVNETHKNGRVDVFDYDSDTNTWINSYPPGIRIAHDAQMLSQVALASDGTRIFVGGYHSNFITTTFDYSGSDWFQSERYIISGGTPNEYPVVSSGNTTGHQPSMGSGTSFFTNYRNVCKSGELNFVSAPGYPGAWNSGSAKGIVLVYKHKLTSLFSGNCTFEGTVKCDDLAVGSYSSNTSTQRIAFGGLKGETFESATTVEARYIGFEGTGGFNGARDQTELMLSKWSTNGLSTSGGGQQAIPWGTGLPYENMTGLETSSDPYKITKETRGDRIRLKAPKIEFHLTAAGDWSGWAKYREAPVMTLISTEPYYNQENQGGSQYGGYKAMRLVNIRSCHNESNVNTGLRLTASNAVGYKAQAGNNQDRITQDDGDYYTLSPSNEGWLRLYGLSKYSNGTVNNMYGDYTSLAVGNFYAAGFIRYSSDDRVKHFEEEIPNCLELITQLKPYKYKKTGKIYTEDYTSEIGEEGKDWHWEIGLIAQDVEKIPYFEHTVSKPENSADGKYSVDYTGFISVCLQGVKDLHNRHQPELAKVATLQSDVATEKEKVATLQSDVATEKEKVAILQSDVATEKEKVATLQSDVITEKEKVVTLETDVEREKLKTTNLQERILVMEQAYHALLERVSDLENS